MQTHVFRRVVRALAIPAVLVTLLAGCSNANDPYAKISDAPLMQVRLHTVTLVADGAPPGEELQKAGYTYTPFPPNYPEADKVQGVLWNVPPEVAASAKVYRAASGPNLRVLTQPSPPAAAPAASAVDAGVERSFFRNVLGTDVPQWPANVPRAANLRVQVWTYQIPNILDARKKLRENAIPLVTEPVGITTAYLGDQKSMSLRAPDGTIVELVETAAQ
jgi:hypothetical protein